MAARAGTRTSISLSLGSSGRGLLPGSGAATLEARVSKITAACAACAARLQDLEAAVAQCVLDIQTLLSCSSMFLTVLDTALAVNPCSSACHRADHHGAPQEPSECALNA